MPLSAPTLTAEQLRARDTRDVSIGVSAGAGCGKTHVLTSRFLSHLQASPDGEGSSEPAALHQLIAITFTDAAAREMRTRIRAACHQRLDDDSLPPDEQQAWLRLLREIDAARVSTIHAFCTALLRTHAAEAGLDPMFGVLEQGEADLLLAEVMDDVLRQRLAAHDPDTLDLAAEFRQLSQLKDRVALLVDQHHRPAFHRWLADTGDEQDRPDEHGEFDKPAKPAELLAAEMLAAWKARLSRDAEQMLVSAAREKIPAAELLRLLAIATPAAGNTKFPAAIATLTDLVTRLHDRSATVTRADLDLINENAKIQNICKLADWPTPEAFDKYKKVCTKTRDVIAKAEPPQIHDEPAMEAALLGQKLLRLAGDVVAAYKLRKQQLARLDFSDQLALAHQLLSDPQRSELCEALSKDLRLLLVDEFQDTDPLQVDLIKKICGRGFDEGRLFFVGDFKQSIYRFRGAVPPEFLKLRQQVPQTGQLQLTENFRSQPGVLHFVNALFHDTFDNYEALQPKRPPVSAAPAVEFLWTIFDPTQAEGTNVEHARRQEAAAIARRLRELLDDTCSETPVVDRSSKDEKNPAPRRLRPGDVAILFRALSDVRIYEEELRKQGLEYYLVGGHAFYAQQEVFDVLNLLRSVASAADEISLAGVLRSPFFALADETLFWLAERGGTLNAGLLAETLPSELADDERAKAAAAARILRHLRARKDVVPLAALLTEALDLTGYDAVLLTEFLGERKLANLHKLIEHARTADGNRHDLHGFVTQLAEFITRPPKEPLASTSAESSDVIRLMTIHRAKGLEFPFVVVPDLNRPPRLNAPEAALDDELGPLISIPNDDDEEKFTTGMTLFAAAERAAELDERKRVLYVATTRAADYLLLSSSVKTFEKLEGDWMRLIADHYKLENGEYLGQLPADWPRPRVHIAPPPAMELKPVGSSRGPDLASLLTEARDLAAASQGIVPPGINPIPPDRTARRQFSFSRLSGRLVAARIVDEAGATGSASAPKAKPLLDARGLGSLVHDVLERIDFNGANLNTEIAEWCEHLAPQYVVQNVEDVASAAKTMIGRFAATPRAQQLAAAKSLHREIEFLLTWPPRGVAGVERSEPPAAGQLTAPYITGKIDCLYEDAAGAWRIVDYKTNEATPNDIDDLVQKYEMQLYVYALAVEQSLGVAPTELVLQLLRPGLEHKIPWNATARTRAIEMVNAALKSATYEP